MFVGHRMRRQDSLELPPLAPEPEPPKPPVEEEEEVPAEGDGGDGDPATDDAPSLQKLGM